MAGQHPDRSVILYSKAGNLKKAVEIAMRTDNLPLVNVFGNFSLLDS
jgi:hypothetical protein